MNIEEQIGVLLGKADLLRPLPDDEPAKAPLTGIVDEINRLRAKQARGEDLPSAQEVRAEIVRKPGRPPKAKVEGDDA